MTKEFVTYEQALALEELGFNESCFGTWDRPDKLWTGNPIDDILGIPEDNVLAPLKQQAFRWFREKYKLVAAITVENDDFDYTVYIPWEIKEEHDSTRFTSYEEAEQACLDKLIEICKTK
jgi:hypothetical protein